MAGELYGLTEDDRSALSEMLAAFRRGELTRPRPIRRHNMDSQRIYIAYSGSTGIAARSGTTPGSATVTLQKITSTGIAASTVTDTAYNISNGAVSANRYLQLKRESLTGRLMVDFEDCT